jgi:hypothetical protein
VSFTETLRRARASRVAVLHEFWTQYDPNQARIHAFFEGHDDIAFARPHIERLMPIGARLYPYRCDGKGLVMEAFTEITNRHPDIRDVLFFVDKDLDDVLGTPWPTDPRIYVTDFYSIENYLVSPACFIKLYRSTVRLTGVNFDEATIATHFEANLNRFEKKMISVMAWILVARRAGKRPNLNNLRMSSVCVVSEGGVVSRLGKRSEALSRETGVVLAGASVRAIPAAARELKRMPLKRIVRGKFDAWYFVEYWNGLMRRLRVLAIEGGGKLSSHPVLSQANFVSTVGPHADLPESLYRFLKAHLKRHEQLTTRPAKTDSGFLKKLLKSIVWPF